MGVQYLSGQKLGQYELRELLGMGGMGAVYAGYQANLKRTVAVKVLPLLVAARPGHLERFSFEAETVAALEHRHIIPIYDYGMQNGISYIVMRLLGGGTLGDRIIQIGHDLPTLPALSEVARLVDDLAGALDYAHSRGIVHRDIKPNNIMFDTQGSAYIVDFGLAKLIEESRSFTTTGVPLGTPTYMAPEQWRAETIVPATDQYALAGIAYTLAAGHIPFDAPTPYALMHKHLNEDVPPPQTYRPDLPAALTAVLARALAKDPQARYPDVQSFAAAFSQAVTGVDERRTRFFTAQLRQRPPTSVGATPILSQVSLAQFENGMRRKPLHRDPLAWLAAVLTVALVIVLALLIASPGDDDGVSRASNDSAASPSALAEAANEDAGGDAAAPDDGVRATPTDDSSATPTASLTPRPTATRAVLPSRTPGTRTPAGASAGTPVAGAATESDADVVPDLADPPDFEQIAYTMRDDDAAELFVANADGSRAVRLTDNRARDGHPDWSPDGRWLVFESERTGNRDIFLASRDGSNVIQLTDEIAYDGQPAWSPDGRSIAFVSDRDGGRNVFILDLAGNAGLRRITASLGADEQPDWSADGASLVFVSERDGNPEIYRVGIDGGEPQRLTENDADDYAPAWGPDGRIAFVSERDGVPSLYVMDADGANRQRLIRTESGEKPVLALDPAWTPDGAQIVFAARESDRADILVLDVASGDRRLLIAGDTLLRNPVPRPQVATPPPGDVLLICTIRANHADAAVRVGPGPNRSVLTYLPNGRLYIVLGRAADDSGAGWWKLRIPGIDEAWVLAESVEETTDCGVIQPTDAPPIVIPPTVPIESPAAPSDAVSATPSPAPLPETPPPDTLGAAPTSVPHTRMSLGPGSTWP